MEEAKGPKVLTRDQIMAKVKQARLKGAYVETPGWGGSVFVQELAGHERDAVEQIFADANAGKGTLINIRARIAQMTIVDPETRARYFTPKEIVELGNASGDDLNRVFRKALALSGMREEDLEEAKGNLPGGQSEDGTSV